MQLALSLLLGLTVPLPTQTAAPHEPDRPGSVKYNLSKVEHMDEFVGSTAAKALLARNGFVVTDQQFPQVFSAYINDPLPKFITTDSVWHTYHVLLEEGVCQLERVQAARLTRFSKRLLDVCRARMIGKGKPAGWELAFLGATGLALQDANAVKALSPDWAKRGAATASALTNGSGMIDLPVGLPVLAGQFRAQSFYADSPALVKYFAARRWYATVDFRLASERETALAVELALWIEADPELKRLYRALHGPYDVLLGPAEDGSVALYARVTRKVLPADRKREGIAQGIVALRKALAAELPLPSVNDQLLTPEQYANFAKEIRGFRLLPPRRTPSATCFQNTVDPHVPGRMFPSGLDFLVACKPLRSPAAVRALTVHSGRDVADRVTRARCGALPESVHGEGMKLLATLQEPLPAAAPTALRTDAWTDKQLWTQLGAWAEQCHTWALHRKQCFFALSLVESHPGLVSPYPRFFAGLGQLSRRSAKALVDADPPPTPDFRKMGQDLVAATELGIRLAKRETLKCTDQQHRLLRYLYRAESAYRDAKMARQFEKAWKLEDRLALREKVYRALGRIGRRAAAGKKLGTEDTGWLLAFGVDPRPAIDNLKRLADLCDELSTIGRKQLAGEALSNEQVELIDRYGTKLAELQFYEGSAPEAARDDFPMISSVFVNPAASSPQTLYAGLARPEALYVIARVGGKWVLYRGVVLSYREMRRPAGEAMDDAAWRRLVRAGRVGPPPRFTASFRANIQVDEVVRMLRVGKLYGDIESFPQAAVTRAMVELLEGGKYPDLAPRLAELVCERCDPNSEGDTGVLTRLLGKVPPDAIDDVFWQLCDMPWKERRDALVDLMSAKLPKRAAAGAAILAHRPDDVDYAALADRFREQDVRARRLYCFVCGHAGAKCEVAGRLLLSALGDAHAGVRWQAARAVAQAKRRDEKTVSRLLANVSDPNPYAAAAAVDALVALEVTRAAPLLLRRLAKGGLPRRAWGEKAGAQYRAIDWIDERYDGSVALMVLEPDARNNRGARPLGLALVEAMGKLGYEPAAGELEKLLEGEYAPEAMVALGQVSPARQRQRLRRTMFGKDGMKALELLEKLDPNGHVDRLFEVAHARKAYCYTRTLAIGRIGHLRRPELIVRLAPLLDDTSPSLPHSGEPRICHRAADAMVELLDWRNEMYKNRTAADWKALLARLRREVADRQSGGHR